MNANNLSCRLFELRHGVSDGRSDISRIANKVFTIVKHKIVSCNLFTERYRSSQMVRIMEQHDVQSEQVAHQNRIENRAILAVRIRVIERFVGEKRSFVPELLLICFILESRLYEIDQRIGSLRFRFSGNTPAQNGLQLLPCPCTQRTPRI